VHLAAVSGVGKHAGFKLQRKKRRIWFARNQARALRLTGNSISADCQSEQRGVGTKCERLFKLFKAPPIYRAASFWGKTAE